MARGLRVAELWLLYAGNSAPAGGAARGVAVGIGRVERGRNGGRKR